MVEVKTYQSSIDYVCGLNLPWEKMSGKLVLISGATGMIGSFLIHVLMQRNEVKKVLAVGRTEKTARERLGEYWESDRFEFIAHDVNLPFKETPKADFILHLASNTHPVAYASDPIGTITANIIGTQNLLEFASHCKTERFLFASSVEIYGENQGDTEFFDEGYCGYIDCNTLRAGYPEGKRAGEALCQAYRKAKGLDIVIARLARVYGPTMLLSDTKAISQFIKNGINKQNIVLKSEGNQLYSYNYVADAVAGLLTILLKGKDGESYNIADKDSDITLKNLAKLIASATGTKVIFDLPSELEREGYSKTTKARMNSDKLHALGWKAHWNITSGIFNTLKEMQDELRFNEEEFDETIDQPCNPSL